MSLSLAVILDTRRIKKRTGKYPLKLRVTYDREPQYYPTIYDLSEEDYKKFSATRLNTALIQIRDKIQEIERKSREMAINLDPFTFADFEKECILNNPSFYQHKSIANATVEPLYKFDASQYIHRFPIFKESILPAGTILVTFRSYIDKLLRGHRIGSAVCYQTSYYAIARFRGNVRFTEITVDFLNDFERWMLNQDYSKTTIGIYVRSLRAIFNEAIEDGLIKRDKYPFGRRRYQIPTSRNIKKSLKLEDVSKIYYYEPACEQEQKAKDFWLFSYLGNGINPKDIACLRYRNIDGDYFTFERAKTEKATRSDPKPISVYITDDMWTIIERWGNKDKNPNNYVFPVLEPDITPLRQYELVELFIRSINDWLVKIRKKLNIEKKLTTYVARHTFSTVLKRSGISTEFIQESLGHTNIMTTEKYLDSFEKEMKKDFVSNLTAFKTKKVIETA